MRCTVRSRDMGPSATPASRPPGASPASFLEPYSLAASELFSELPREALADLERDCRLLRFEPGEMVLDSESPQAHGVYVVLQGVVDVFKPADCGDAVALGELSPGACFGEFSAVDGRMGSADVRARVPTVLAEIPRSVFVDLLAREPSVSLQLTRRLIRLIRRHNDRMARLHGYGDEAGRMLWELFRVSL